MENMNYYRGNANIIYENNCLQVKKGICEKDIVGAFTVLSKYKTEECINYDEIVYAKVVYGIRKCLWENGVEIVGIYKEGYKTYIIPFHLDILEEMNIEFDAYQEYIQEYLEFSPNVKGNLELLDNKILYSVVKNIEDYVVDMGEYNHI